MSDAAQYVVPTHGLYITRMRASITVLLCVPAFQLELVSHRRC